MSEERKKIILDNIMPVEIYFNKQFIKIKPYISLNDKMKLLKIYIDSFFSEDEFYVSYIQAEYSIILAIIDMCTDLDINELKIDNVIESGLWDEIFPKIKNYDSLRKDLELIVKNMKEDIIVKKSIGSVIDDIFSKIIPLIERISEIDLSKDSVNNLVEKLNEINVSESFGVVQKKNYKKKKANLESENI